MSTNNCIPTPCDFREEGSKEHSIKSIRKIAEEFGRSYDELVSDAKEEDCFLCKNIESCTRAVVTKQKYDDDMIYDVARELGMIYVSTMLDVIPPFDEEMSNEPSEMIEGLGETDYATRRVISWAIFMTQAYDMSREDAINHVETLEMRALNSLSVNNLCYSVRLSALQTLIALK